MEEGARAVSQQILTLIVGYLVRRVKGRLLKLLLAHWPPQTNKAPQNRGKECVTQSSLSNFACGLSRTPCSVARAPWVLGVRAQRGPRRAEGGAAGVGPAPAAQRPARCIPSFLISSYYPTLELVR